MFIIKHAWPKKINFFLIAFAAIFLFSSETIFAAMSLTFSGAPASVFEEEPFEIDVSLINAPTNRTYYLRAAFYQEGKNRYFGYTCNQENNWHNSPSEHKKFLQITTSEEGSWSGKLKAKADLEASSFKGGGDYGFKIGRYTEGGSGPTWSATTTVIVINISPSSSPVSSEEPSSSSTTSSPSPSEETSSLVQTSTPVAVEVTGATLLGQILGEGGSSPPSYYSWEATEEGESQEATETPKPKIISKLFLGLGLAFLFSSGLFLCYNRLRLKQ